MEGLRDSVGRTRRSFESLEWELELIYQLNTIGFRVSRTIRADISAWHSDGVVVQELIGGP
jgi:hypothetical protein